jgi:hypothetical protein
MQQKSIVAIVVILVAVTLLAVVAHDSIFNKPSSFDIFSTPSGEEDTGRHNG